MTTSKITPVGHSHGKYISIDFEISPGVSKEQETLAKDSFDKAITALEVEWSVKSPMKIGVSILSDSAFRQGATSGPQSWKYCFLLRDQASDLKDYKRNRVYCNVEIFSILPSDADRMIKHETAHLIISQLIKNLDTYKISFLLEEGTAGLDGATDRLITIIKKQSIKDIPNPLSINSIDDLKRIGGDTNIEPFIDQLGYLTLFSFTEFLRKKYGEAKIIEVYKSLGDQSAIDQAFKKICNTNLPDIANEWMISIKKLLSKQRSEPTPSAKREISMIEALSFLSKYYSSEVSNLKELAGGKHSKAFSYEYAGQGLIVRFNTEDRGFLKDKYAFEHFGKNIPIPKVIEIGTHKDLSYCITEKIPGETARDQYNKNDFSSLPLLLGAVEEIGKIKINGTGYGYLDLNSNAPYKSSSEYMYSVYHSNDLFDWHKIFQIPFVDKNFTDHVAERMEHFAQFATDQRELLHGDFGADNVFIKNNAVSGIIDWEKMRSGDHFLDVGRILLFCPNRQATTSAAIDFYKDKKITNWIERAAMGVYHVVLTNYAYAALGDNETSCRSSKVRLKEIERGLGLI